MLQALHNFGVPEHALHFIKALYDNNKCNIIAKGGEFSGCMMESGVRQGCPLSPLLFAVCVDILLRMLDKRIDGGIFRAFADDIAAIVQDFWKDGKIG